MDVEKKNRGRLRFAFVQLCSYFLHGQPFGPLLPLLEILPEDSGIEVVSLSILNFNHESCIAFIIPIHVVIVK